MFSNWDKNLPELELHNVTIHAGSLQEAWKEISSRYLVRSVLALSDSTATDLPFDFDSSRCTVGNLYSALVKTYKLNREQDKRTGVEWLYSVNLQYPEILSVNIKVDKDFPGHPMYSGILGPVAENSSNGVVLERSGTIFKNTFDYPVDLFAGYYAIRDIINLCCVANFTKTFLINVQNKVSFITPVNLVSDDARLVPEGAAYFWKTEIEEAQAGKVPEKGELVEALANKEPQVRSHARNYLESIVWRIKLDEWAQTEMSVEQKLWSCIGITSVLIRSENATHLASVQLMEELATNSFLENCECQIGIITALELARLTNNPGYWAVIKKRDIDPNCFLKVSSDACRIAAQSEFVCKMLRSDVALLPKTLAGIVQANRSGRIEFSLSNDH